MYFSSSGDSMPVAEEFTPLTRPPQSPVSIDPNRRSCPSEGFNYPTFRLVNKKTRVYLSEPFTLDRLKTYHPLAVANTKGWFAAIRKIGDAQDIILSPLKELRDSFQKASEDDEGYFFPQRDLSLDAGIPTIVAFSRRDTRLMVGTDSGTIYVYDTVTLFSSGSDPVKPLRTYSEQPGILHQISPNPGTESDLVDIIAVVRSNGVVHLMNTMLESLGGWSTAEPNAGPVAVSWSPKGKHLAIGLQSGDILTFALNNKSTPNKHIPATAEGRLVGLNWLSPGHTFRLSYAPQIENGGEPIQQIISLDIKSNTLAVFETLYPFTMTDRPQEPHTVILPHWDEDSITESSKSLVVVGDQASVDLEILGGHGGQWHQQSQENPVSLPLDKQTEETTLMSLATDLTDTSTLTPIIYAYLNDGSLQAWSLEHSKPYLQISSSTVGNAGTQLALPTTSDVAPDSAMDDKEAANVLTSLSSVNQSLSTPSAGTFGSNVGQQSSVFGATSQSTSVFGQTSSPTFGKPSVFGSLSSGSSTFGQPSTFGSSQPASSSFGPAGSGTTFGGAFGGIASQRTTTNVFGTSSFGVSSPSTSPPNQFAPPSEEMTREASMSDGTTPSFGGLSLGGGSSDSAGNKARAGIFGSFGTAPTSQAPASSALGGIIKPAQGFGTLSSFGSTGPVDSSVQEKSTVSAFSSPPQTSSHSAFGQTAFGKPAFGQTSFGQPGFGQTGFGKGPAATSGATNTGGFAAFASSSPSSFGSALQASESTTPSTGGFSAFASGGATAFGSGVKQAQQVASNNASPFGPKTEATGSPFASGSSSPFAAGSPGLANARTAFTSSTSGFELRDREAATTTPQGSPIKPSTSMVSPPSSPEPAGSSPALGSKRSTLGSNISAPSSSFLQRPTGFGALGAVPQSSPFFKKPEAKAPPVTAFGNIGQTSNFKPLSSTTTAPTFGSPSQLGPARGTSTVAPIFGATSQLGAVSKATLGSTTPTTTPATTPTKAPAAGGFGAFSGGTSAFSAFAGQKSSFSQLLKGEDKDEGESGKVTSEPAASKEDDAKVPSTPSKPVSVFSPLSSTQNTPSATSIPGTPRTPTSDVAKDDYVESTTPKGKANEQQQGSSLSSLSTSSVGSFVDVGADESHEEGEKEEDDNGDDTRSFLSSDFSSEPSTEDEASDEESQPDEDKEKASDDGSPSPTPQPEVPSVQVTPSPPAEALKSSVSSSKEESTTPPGSPSNEVRVPSKSPSPTPFSTPSATSSPSPSPFGIGLGRPSTRPVRSSPLAAAPVSGEDEEEEGQVKEDKTFRLARTANSPSGLPSAKEESIKQEDDSTTSKRPHTPLLSSFEGLRTAKTTSIIPLAPKPEPDRMQSPLSSTGSPIPSPQLVSVFPKLSEPAPQAEVPPRPATTPVSGNLPADRSEADVGIRQVPKTAPATPTGSPFSLPPFLLTPKPTSPPQGSFVTPIPTSTIPKPTTEAQQPSPGLFVTKTPPSPFGPQADQAPAGTPQPPPQTPPLKPAGAPPASQLPAGVEEGLQRECYVVVKLMEEELKNLSELGARAAQKRKELNESVGGSRLKVDLGVPDKWNICDAITFGQTLSQFEKDLIELKETREAFKQTVRELNSNMLKANTRREEIARFDKAKTDKEFAKMLSNRSLGPEHVEAQQQLRRSIRTIRDRVQKLESHLQESKKKLSQAASGRPSIRAPTLDIVNRTYRNIDIAIQQQTDEVAQLAERVTRLKVSPTGTPSPSRDVRLPDPQRRSRAVTPHVAVTTAAALNAERSAHKLKKALLKVRKEPILNEKAASAPQPPLEFETPQKPLASSGIFGPVPGSLFSAPEGQTEIPIPDLILDLPEDNFNPGTPLPSSRRGASSHPKKHGSVPLKKTLGGTMQSPPAPTADFWGPLPTFTNPPLTKLPAEVKPIIPITPPTPTPSTFIPISKTGSSSSLPGGGFEAFMKRPS